MTNLCAICNYHDACKDRIIVQITLVTVQQIHTHICVYVRENLFRAAQTFLLSNAYWSFIIPIVVVVAIGLNYDVTKIKFRTLKLLLSVLM